MIKGNDTIPENKESLDRNLAIRKKVKDDNLKWTDHGIVKK